MSVLWTGTLIIVRKPKKIKCDSELWSTKIIDLKGQGKHDNFRHGIHLVDCMQVEPDNYSSEKFTIMRTGGMYIDELIAADEAQRLKWITNICDVCGLTNPLKRPKLRAPLPPPKTMSKEKILEEENAMYERISGDEEDYTPPVARIPPQPVGDVLEYHYPNFDRAIRSVSLLDEHGSSGGSAVGTSGSGSYRSYDEDDEYIEPANIKTVQQQPSSNRQDHQYRNTSNTLDGKILALPKGATLPSRSPSLKEKSPIHIPTRRPSSPPPVKSPNPFNFKGASIDMDNSELFAKLSKRKDKVERSTGHDDVFVVSPNVPKSTPQKNSPMMPSYKNIDVDHNEKFKPPLVPPKTSSSSSSGSPVHRKPFDKETPKTKAVAGHKNPLPVQDPPWLSTSHKRSVLPEQDPPWRRSNDVEAMSTSRKPRDAAWLNKKSPPEDRLDKPCPLPSHVHEDKTTKRHHISSSPPPPPPPERGSSRKSIFDPEPSRVRPSQSGDRRPMAPPASSKPHRLLVDDDDDEDFPMADQYKVQVRTGYNSVQPPSLPHRSKDPIDRPPIRPPKQSNGYHY